LVESIHEQKTVALFRAACELGALAGGAEPDARQALSRYGQMVGRAFQIADDLLDVNACETETGKKTRKDQAAGKQTYPRCVGEERARAVAEGAARGAIAAIDRFGSDADDLRALASFTWNRAH
jgi:geranylgeranyl pyrophosphate synthase